MNRLVPLLVVASLGLGGTVVWQNQQLSAERLRVGALSESLSTSEARAAELENELAQLRQANAAFQSESEQLRKKLASRSEADRANASTETKLEAPGGKGKEKGNFMQAMAKMFTDPEMKKAMRGQQAMGIRMIYGDLSKELGLTPDEADQVIELLTDRQMALTGKSMELMNAGNQDEAKMKELRDGISESRKEYNHQLENILGKERYSKLETYERTLGERMVLNQLDQQFSARGMALQEPQRQQLLQAMIDERLKAPPTPWDPSNPDVGAQMNAIRSDEMLKRLFEQQQQINTRVLDRARGFLTLDQLNTLQQSQQEFLQMQQVGMKMGREMLSK